MNAAGFSFRVVLGVLLVAGLFAIYSVSIPDAFNTRYENRRFFDSDGEFITRQFRHKKTYTHNDHLLYHVLAQTLYDHADAIPGVARDPVSVHKAISVTSGALAALFLYLGGLAFGASPARAASGALAAAGCAGWWFFSATIDTYMPAVAASCLALWAAIGFLRTRRARWIALLAAAAGLAFLFRTDGFLLAPLGLVLFADRSRFARNFALRLPAWR